MQCSMCMRGLDVLLDDGQARSYMRLVVVFCLSHCEVSFCFPNVGFATFALGTIHDI